MSINLEKGQKISLTKDNPGLSQLMVGLGWDVAKTGIVGKLLGSPNKNFDLDASAILLNAENKVSSVVYYGELKSRCGSVIHSGDNLTGAGDGDDEIINIDLSKVPSTISKIVFIVNIYDCVNRKQHFGMVENAFIRLVNKSNNEELANFNLSQKHEGKTALVLGELYRNNDEWKFSAIGESTTDISIKQFTQRY